MTTADTIGMRSLEAIGELIEVVEARLPAQPGAPKYLRAAKRIEAIMRRHFDAIAAALDEDDWAMIYYRHVEATPMDALRAEWFSDLDRLLATLGQQLHTELAGELIDIYLSASAEMVTWGRTQAGIPIAFEGPPIQQAIDYAERHISKAKLVDGLNAETKRTLSKVISDGIANKRGIPGITSDLRHKLGWMARGAPSDIKGLTLKSRAEMIARTETANALSAASLDRSKDMGVTHKEWITVGDSEVSEECLGNEAQGAIPVNQVFSGGTLAPPQHPRCRCSLAPSMEPEG